MTTLFRVNSPNVIHETIEDEVILIDLKTGTYYSLRDAGAVAWAAIERGVDAAGLAAVLEQRYAASADEIEAAVQRLLGDLEREGLVRQDAADDASAVPAGGETVSERVPFKPPVLEKHTDMQDLILIDPVHEVGAAGWPHPQEATEASA